LAQTLPGRPRGLLLAACLVVLAGGLVLATGPAGHDRDALAAMGPVPAGTQPGSSVPVAAAPASTLDALSGASGIDPLDLIGKGVIVAALLYLTLRALRRMQAGPASGSRRLQVIETRPLGPKASLHLVAVGERRLVVGLSPGGIVAIAELEATELAETAVAIEPNLDPSGVIGDSPVDLRTALASCLVAARQFLGGRITRPDDAAGFQPGGRRP
jgi:flagellar biosynthetic protein FliO